MNEICFFAALIDETMCSIKDEILGCGGKIEDCPINKLREQELDLMFEEMERFLCEDAD